MESTSTQMSNLTGSRTRMQALRTVLLTSLAVTATCAPVALAVTAVSGGRFLTAFVVLRWLVVLVLLLTPIAYRTVFVRAGWNLPYVMQTPLTALFLTCESIAVDIISAQIHRM